MSGAAVPCRRPFFEEERNMFEKVKEYKKAVVAVLVAVAGYLAYASCVVQQVLDVLNNTPVQ